MAKKRVIKTQEAVDLGSASANTYNDYNGTSKIMIIEPVIERAYTASAHVGYGKYILISAASYNLIDTTGVNPPINGIPTTNATGVVVCTGERHNAISVAGFIVKDDTHIR